MRKQGQHLFGPGLKRPQHGYLAVINIFLVVASLNHNVAEQQSQAQHYSHVMVSCTLISACFFLARL